VAFEDILIASIDGLKGFPEAINAIFPQTEVQLCIVHQIRNSMRYVASKDQKEFATDLPVYNTKIIPCFWALYRFQFYFSVLR